MKINIEVANTPESIQMTKDHLANVKVVHNNKRVETFVVSLDDLHDLGYFGTSVPDAKIYKGIVALKQQRVLQ